MPDLPRSLAIAPWSCPRTAAVPAAGGALFGIRLVLERRAVAIPGSGYPLRGISDFELGRRTPQSLQVIIPPRFFAEDGHNEAAEIEQRPVRRAIALTVPHRPLHLFMELLVDFCADCLNLWRTKASANHKVVCERARSAEVQHDNAGGFLFLRGLDSEADALWQGFEGQRYKPCLRMYSSTRAETSPWMDWPFCARRRMSVAETSLETFSSR